MDRAFLRGLNTANDVDVGRSAGSPPIGSGRRTAADNLGYTDREIESFCDDGNELRRDFRLAHSVEGVATKTRLEGIDDGFADGRRGGNAKGTHPL